MQSNPEVRAFAERQGWSGDFSQLQGYFTNRLVRHISHLNRTLVVWQEVFDTGTQMDINSTIVQVRVTLILPFRTSAWSLLIDLIMS